MSQVCRAYRPGAAFPGRAALLNKDTMNYPPPVQVSDIDELPDYYLGRLIVFEPMATDRCRWVVYDGASKVRCYTRTEAVDYINEKVKQTGEEEIRRTLRARYFLLKTMGELDAAAHHAVGADKLLLERLSVRLRPFLVEIDNFAQPKYELYEKLPNHTDERENTEAAD